MEQIRKLTSSERETILRQVLHQYDIPESAFSIGVPAEQRVCLEEDGGRYHIYIMERGMVFEESQHTTEAAAHLEMLNQLAESKNEYRQMCRTYENLVNMKSKGLMDASRGKMISSYGVAAIKHVHVGDVVRIGIKPSLSGPGKEVKGVVIRQRPKSLGGAIIIQKDISGLKNSNCIALLPSQIKTVTIVHRAESRRSKLGRVKGGIKKLERVKGKLKR